MDHIKSIFGISLIALSTCAFFCIIFSFMYDYYYHWRNNHNEQQDLEGSAAQDIGELHSDIDVGISIIDAPPSYDDVTLPSYESLINGSNI